MEDRLRSLASTYSYTGDTGSVIEANSVELSRSRVSKPATHKTSESTAKAVHRTPPKVARKKKTSHIGNNANQLQSEQELKDLPPLLKEGLTVVFIGFNPGVQSSLTQHHYAHFSNLFWKLFNQSGLFQSVQQHNTGQKAEQETEQHADDFVNIRVNSNVSSFTAFDDNRLLDYGIGFTDLVLRCTKAVSELSSHEKLANVPRLVQELRHATPSYIVIIGKGIWEIIARYLNDNKTFKLSNCNFRWGRQLAATLEDPQYSALLAKLSRILNYNYSIYVFPNTSGLVTSLKFSEKLELWNTLVRDIYKDHANSRIDQHGCDYNL